MLSLLCAALLAASSSSQAAKGARPFELMVGDPAPALPVARWLKGAEIARFEPGRIYLVEFWATYSLPSTRTFQQLCELQRQHADRLTVVAIDVWENDPAAGEPFVQRMGERMAFTVGQDDVPPAPRELDKKSRWSAEHGKVTRAWMTASGWREEGLPTVFLVNGEGRVAWIGAPGEMAAPLEQLLAGRWDLAREAEVYRQRMLRRVETRPILGLLRAAQQRRDWDEVVARMDQLMALDPEANAALAGGKFQTLLVELRRPEEAYAFAREALTSIARDDVAALGQIAYVIAFLAPSVHEPELALARTAVTRANELARGERAPLLDTLARVHFLAHELEQAVAVETLALEKATDEAERKEYAKRLQEYQRAKDG